QPARASGEHFAISGRYRTYIVYDAGLALRVIANPSLEVLPVILDTRADAYAHQDDEITRARFGNAEVVDATSIRPARDRLLRRPDVRRQETPDQLRESGRVM